MKEDIKVLKELLNYDFNQLSKEEYKAIENLIERNNKLTSLFYKIRDELKKLLITYDGEYYRPIKNTTKQEIYSSYFKLRTLLKGEYCFKDNKTALEELLKERNLDNGRL